MKSCEPNSSARRFMDVSATAPPAPEIKSGFEFRRVCFRQIPPGTRLMKPAETRAGPISTPLSSGFLPLAACPPPAKGRSQRRIAPSLARKPAKNIIRARI